MLSGSYGLTSTHVYKYAQRVNGKVVSANAMTKAMSNHSLKMARGLGKISAVTGAIGSFYSFNTFFNDYNQGGWEQASGWDLADGVIGGGSVIVGVLAGAGIVSNPVGWVVGIGSGLYFTGRLIYDIATEP